ncbi:MAG: CoB--CoM heterodisulfide reductase iron-sulfur subunit B family protein [Planctomycetota bacterium]|nr:CoB--CoM heterodisulfide reductase iron-sulfur subunit B family protein [Planctomycetota bacterium]
MKYLYYPGCSLKGTSRGYEESILAIFEKLQLPLQELEGWNCCGATAYMAVDEIKALALAARNLALAEQVAGNEPVSLVAPCNSCYLVLSKAQRHMEEFEDIGDVIVKAMREAGLRYEGHVHVRHPLDVLVNDVGLDALRRAASQPLNGLKVACYYGCQVVRPYATFDDQHNPQTMHELLKAVGAEPVDWSLGTRCCGGSLTGTIEKAGLRLCYILLREAKVRGADAVATCCPLCQFNLECYQGQIASMFGDEVDIPVTYFSQLLGKAMGIDERTLGLKRLFVPLTTAAV